MFYGLYTLPLWAGAALFASVFVGTSSLVITLAHPRVRRLVAYQSNWNTVMGPVMSAFGLFYGITLALIVVSAYQNYAQAGAVVGQEAATLGILYRNVSRYPEPARGELQTILRTYTRDVIAKDWPLQKRGVVPEGGTAQATAFQERLLAFRPRTRTQEIVYADTLREFSTFVAHRRSRLNDVTQALPVMMWVVMGVGALLYLLLIALFDIKSLRMHVFIGGILSLLVSLLIFLTVALDNPFRGDLSVSPEAFELVRESLMGP